MDIKIQQATELNKEGLLQLFRETADYHSSLDPYYLTGNERVGDLEAMIEKLLTNKVKNRILVALDGNKLVGLLVGKIQRGQTNTIAETVGFIMKAYVVDEYRGQGIMKKLMAEIDIWFDDKKVEYVELIVSDKNETGKAVWKSFGFETHSLRMKKKRV